ncbi:unnamed protein product [Adineta ricciae]|uniref:Biotin carboxylase n=1 Tax=Adineta ricciae TaxID=249248 RepID=A0A815ND00_ADIRI|nr:unnamed protein product [Adineta ricciae]
MKSVLIANRGEIAVRVARTLRRMGIESVAIYSEADRNSVHVRVADRSIELKGFPSSEIYLQSQLIIDIAKEEKVDGIFPGYGFLSENAEFARQCEKEGICFIGPTSEQIYQFGLKHISYELACEAKIPVLPRSELLNDIEDAKRQALRIEYPIMLKSTAGSGGKGMCQCWNEKDLENVYETVQRSAQKYLQNDGLYVEKYVEHGRHIEIQIFGDGKGFVRSFVERDCSLQRRNQKIVEESPATNLSDEIRCAMSNAAVQLASLVKYRSVGTVEFILDEKSKKFYFLEVNCRLQVEHPITEMIYGIDLVEWMIKLSSNEQIEQLKDFPKPIGCAIEVRLCSENPLNDFCPSTGKIYEIKFPQTTKNIRIDTWICNGIEICSFYDSLLAKIIVHGQNRQETIEKLSFVLQQIHLYGIETNLHFLRQLISSNFFLNEQNLSLQFLTKVFHYEPKGIEILQSGTFTTIQDYPGRIGFWNVGIPPSGPMDHFAFRIANRLIGNKETTSALEITLHGPQIRFHQSTTIAITGATMKITLDNKSIPLWKQIFVEKGQILEFGKLIDGCRTYLAVRGGFDVPSYLGSQSTFVLGQFGGFAGRILQSGDFLFLNSPISNEIPLNLPMEFIPVYPNRQKQEKWSIAVLHGPHGSPDFFSSEFIHEFLQSTWKVHHNSNRLGIRLIGPKPIWTRQSGGDAGLHPSNIHDCQYAIGSINFTGDSPVILTQDGPSLGGFVCPFTIIQADLWKIGQLKPNDQIQFYSISFDQALTLEKQQNHFISTLSSPAPSPPPSLQSFQCILKELKETSTQPRVVYRQAGDHYILIEYGSMNLDLHHRFRIHFLMEQLEKEKIQGIQEISPGVSSLQIHFDGKILHE